MSTTRRLAIDAAAFLGVLIAYNPAVTGIALHEWLSVAAAATMFVHLVVNWEWCVRVASRLFQGLASSSRLNFVVDTALFVVAVGVMLSGLMVSQSILPFFGLHPAASPIWVFVHSVTADAVIVLMLTHLVLHWRWLVRAIRSFVATTEWVVAPEYRTRPNAIER